MPIEIAPVDLKDLSEALVRANAARERVSRIDLRRLNRVLEHTPEDMTVTAEAGITLAELETQLQRHGQWLPIDPPNPEGTTIGAILATKASGPRRFGYGTVRDYVIGMRVALADGTIIKSGGKVVKNVAGYDLAKLFIGSQGTLGVIVEATFKLRPLPEREAFVQCAFSTLDEAVAFVNAVLESKLKPIVLDLHNLEGSRSVGAPPPEVRAATERMPSKADSNKLIVVLGFAGAREDVDCELARAAELGATTTGKLQYEEAFWNYESPEPIHKRSVLPSQLSETLREIGKVPFVARAGNGIVHYRGGPVPPKAAVPRQLFQRVKDAFDPNHIFPSLPE